MMASSACTKSARFIGSTADPAARTVISSLAVTSVGGRHWESLHAWAVTVTVSSTSPVASAGTRRVAGITTVPSHTEIGASAKSKRIGTPAG